jgi:hypothetical protein
VIYGVYDITRNWQGAPLETLKVVVNPIGSIKTEKGLEVRAWLNGKRYQKGRKVTAKDPSEGFSIRSAAVKAEKRAGGEYSGLVGIADGGEPGKPHRRANRDASCRT